MLLRFNMIFRYSKLTGSMKKAYAQRQIDLGGFLVKSVMSFILLATVGSVVLRGKGIENPREVILSLANIDLYVMIFVLFTFYFFGLFEKYNGMRRLNELESYAPRSYRRKNGLLY